MCGIMKFFINTLKLFSYALKFFCEQFKSIYVTLGIPTRDLVSCSMKLWRFFSHIYLFLLILFSRFFNGILQGVVKRRPTKRTHKDAPLRDAPSDAQKCPQDALFGSLLTTLWYLVYLAILYQLPVFYKQVPIRASSSLKSNYIPNFKNFSIQKPQFYVLRYRWI